MRMKEEYHREQFLGFVLLDDLREHQHRSKYVKEHVYMTMGDGGPFDPVIEPGAPATGHGYDAFGTTAPTVSVVPDASPYEQPYGHRRDLP